MTAAADGSVGDDHGERGGAGLALLLVSAVIAFCHFRREGRAALARELDEAAGPRQSCARMHTNVHDGEHP